MEVIHDVEYVYLVQYHIVWYVKYRHKILVPTISENTEEQIRKYIQNQKRK